MIFEFSLVQDQIYTFGGYSSSELDSIFSSNDLCNENSYESNYSSCDTNIESFTQLTTESMPSADEQYQVVYNNKSSYNECIFVFGGNNADSDVLCFNLTNLTFTENFGSPTFASSNNRLSRIDSLLIINETSGDEFIYYTSSGSTPSLYKFDITNGGVTTRLNGESSISGLSYPPCMVQNPFDDDELLFVHGYGDAFLVYSISDDTFSTGQSLYTSVVRPFCVVIDNEYQDDEPYLYVFGGRTDKIQRLKLNSDDGILNTDWETMTQVLSVNDSNCDADWSESNAFSLNGFLHHELIYIFYDCVISFNILDHSIEYVTHFSDVKKGFGGA